MGWRKIRFCEENKGNMNRRLPAIGESRSSRMTPGGRSFGSHSGADSSPINRSMFVGIASALATKASPVAPENRPLDVEHCGYIDRIASDTPPPDRTGVRPTEQWY